MAVPAEKRTTPSLQYVTTAKNLAEKVEALTERYPPHQWGSMGMFMCWDVSMVLMNVQLVDSMYLRTDDDLEAEYDRLEKALGHLAHLEVMLDMSVRSFGRMNEGISQKQLAELAKTEDDPTYRPKRFKRKGPSESDLEKIAEMISEERNLIKGVKHKASDLLAGYKDKHSA